MHKQVPFLDIPLYQLIKPLEEDGYILTLSIQQRIHNMFDAVSNDDMLHIFCSSNYFLILPTYQFVSDISCESRYPLQLEHPRGKCYAETPRQCIPCRNCDSYPPQKNYLSSLYYKLI